jgi:hypothetical protein
MLLLLLSSPRELNQHCCCSSSLLTAHYVHQLNGSPMLYVRGRNSLGVQA